MRDRVICFVSMAKKPPKSRSRKKPPALTELQLDMDPTHSWFGRYGCVVRRDSRVELVMHKTLVGSWEEGETAIRNAFLVQLAKDPQIILEDLARAFGLSSEAIRLIRRKAEAEGLLSVMLPTRRDSTSVAPELRERMEKLFTQGKKGKEVHRALDGQIALSTVSKYFKRWEALAAEAAPQELVESQSTLPFLPVEVFASAPVPPAKTKANAPTAEVIRPSMVAEDSGPETVVPPAAPFRAPREESEYRAAPLDEEAETADEERGGATRRIEPCLPKSQRSVQHAGTWLLMAMIATLGLYEDARELFAQKSHSRHLPLRIALDALIAALAIGEGCVEGVRRLVTRTCTALLLSTAAPSATWIRRTLGSVAKEPVSGELHNRLAAGLIHSAHEQTEPGRPSVFFIDNHTREYTGALTLAWHWKMQADRAVPGVTDYWIHNAHGLPITPITAFQQGSLVAFLPPCAKVLRDVLGKEPRVLAVFDRGGAFPTAMVELRELPEGSVDFLTYERAPFKRYGPRHFKKHGKVVRLIRAGKQLRVLVLDHGKNLGEGRGRVRRLSLLMPGDVQINLLTSSDQDPPWLISTLFLRWVQENGFKFGGERWGFDQLDSRQAEPYPKGTTIPNPYRRNLERVRDETLAHEGKLRCRLARLLPGALFERAELKKDLAEALHSLARIKGALSESPKRTLIEQTDLHGTLVHHQREYKHLVDTIRIACVNAEGKLARMLQPHLTEKPEAKRVLQNLFKAPGNIRVTSSRITVTLDPSANRAELRAIVGLLRRINRMRLPHPGDPKARPLKFALQKAL